MILAGKSGELIRIRHEDTELTLKAGDVPAGNLSVKETALKTLSDDYFVDRHFYFHFENDKLHTVWGGPKDVEPREKWWENKPNIIPEAKVG